ncbi:MAG: HK97 family phage prohead protease [Cetobacterium sp.]
MSEFLRTFDLEDISVRAGGSGRTVTAYAAVFARAVPVHDFDGDYSEIIEPGAFSRTITRKQGRFQVLFNHGRSIHGTPSDRYSMPLGVATEVREDKRGVLTVVEYANTELADEVLELIKAGAIRAQSFSGRWVKSNPQAGPYRGGEVVRRIEVDMREFGPTPFPVYEAAEVVGVRSDLVAEVERLSADDRTRLAAMLAGGPPVSDPTSPQSEPPHGDPSQSAEGPAPAQAAGPPRRFHEDRLALARRRM